MSEIVSIEKNLPHTVAELMCVSCLSRWVGSFPSDKCLSDLECPHCFKKGFIIKAIHAGKIRITQKSVAVIKRRML